MIMGGGTFDAGAYRTFTSSTVGKKTDEIYTSRHLHKDLNPHGVKVRESRDSTDNPNSTPLIVALDVTGSMGMLADVIAREGLGTLFTGILDRKPISDPHVMFMAVGDANCDRAPLQVSQFEADKRIIEQLTHIYLEHGGGGNNFESYNFPWYFAAFHTVHDSMEKRGKRGYLFTVGDEETPAALTKGQIKQFIGDDVEAELSTQDLLQLAQRSYDVYHVIIEEGNHAKMHLDRVVSSWTELLGQHVIRLKDHKKLAETIVSAIEVAEGRDAEVSAGAWGGGTAKIVHDAVKSLPRRSSTPLLGRGL
jgi:hypothetical protein